MLIGYMRPYHDDQTCDSQLIELRKSNCVEIFAEEYSSAKNRKYLKNMLDSLKKGDKVVIAKLFSLADSTHHLVELLELIEEKGAYIKSIKEELDTSDGSGYPFSHIVKHLVEFQSDVISENTKKGLCKAQQKGVTTGRPRKPDENVQRAIIMYDSKKYSLAEIRDKTGISKTTLYRYLEN
ncbi:recombinase family protein [Carnobacterium funditum]|uniref:recombinase family protein n=1 Tax=Carnobacterium funditum TaxID=2752 RepID=UPI0005515F81|nr:recombinase family protein [Carnobacterium funditum]